MLASKWLELGWPQRFTLIEAAGMLTVAQIATRLLPFRWLAPRLGHLASTLPVRSDAPTIREQTASIQHVGWAVSILARYLPWDSRCLAQAVAAKWMLRRRGLPSTLYLGVDHDQDRWLQAHAWLRCGDQFVTGESQHERFKVIAEFIED